jgi:hypothetical protein
MLNSSQSIQRASLLVKHNINNSIGVREMQEIVEILRLLSKAIEQNTVNTYQEQGAVAADAVFAILQEAERKIAEFAKTIK